MPDRQTIREGLLAVLRHSDEPMVFSDPHLPDNPIVAANAAFQALTGYAEAEIVGRNCRFLQGAKTDPQTVLRMRACLADGVGFIHWLANYRRDGSEFYNLLFMSPVLGPDGRVLFYFANQHNLSEGGPDLADFPIGPAHMPPPQQAAFHHALVAIGEVPATDTTRALETAVTAARTVAFHSKRLAQGPA